MKFIRKEDDMNETYVEVLVKRKTPIIMSFLKILTIMIAVCFVLLGAVFGPAIIIGVVMGIAAYFIYLNADVEYEYLYVDRELTVDKIMAKSKRKRIASFDMGKMEVLAPINSHQLDSYKNRKVKVVDFSSGEVTQPDKRFAFFYDGTTQVIIEPNGELIKAITMIAPRKVFKD